MTTTCTIKARDILATDLLVFRSRIRQPLRNAAELLDLDNDGRAFVNMPLEAVQGLTLNAWMYADDDVSVIR